MSVADWIGESFLNRFQSSDPLLEPRHPAKRLLSRRFELLLPCLQVEMNLLQSLGDGLHGDRQSDNRLSGFTVSSLSVGHACPRDGQNSANDGGNDLFNHETAAVALVPV